MTTAARIAATEPIDPILSVIVAVLVFRSAVFVVRRSAHILLEGAPDWVSVDEIRQRLTRDVSGVAGIHHVHVWGLTQEHLILTMHLVIEPDVERQSAVVRSVKQILEDEYGIAHSTIETELDDCTDAA